MDAQQGFSGLQQAVNTLGFMVTAMCCLLIAVLVYVGWTTSRLLRFISKVDSQINVYLAEHSKWTDVAVTAAKIIPEVLKGGSELCFGIDNLVRTVKSAGGLVSIIGKEVGNAKGVVRRSRSDKPSDVVPGPGEAQAP